MTQLNLYKDRCLKDNEWIMKLIQGENAEQLLKWGIQIHTAFEWLTFTAEEMGELAKAISEYEFRDKSTKAKMKIVKEAIQVATLALKIAEMFEKQEAI